MPREPTRAKILDAARKEFGSKGFDGARVEAIARRAGVNKGLVFYYFQSKEGLFRSLAEMRMSPQTPTAADGSSRDNPFEWPLGLFALQEETQDWVRFFLWEGLSAESTPAPELLMEKRRKQAFEKRVERVRRQQADGALPAGLDAAQLTFFLYVMGVYPYMVPQMAYLITGMWPTDERFRSEFEAFLRGLQKLMGQAAPGS